MTGGRPICQGWQLWAPARKCEDTGTLFKDADRRETTRGARRCIDTTMHAYSLTNCLPELGLGCSALSCPALPCPCARQLPYC